MNNFYTFLFKIVSTYGSKLKKIFVTCCALVLITEITMLKKAILNILSFMKDQKLLFGFTVRMFRNFYTVCRNISIVIIFISIAIFIIYYLLRPGLEKVSKGIPITAFEESLSKYLMDTTGKFSKKGYLVSGEWGSGKTYLVEDFFDRYFRFNKRPIYKISCFGLDTREQVLKEIETQIEENDNSFLNWIQYIPIVGLPIFGILKKTYSLQNISSKSIFIFDDFERITPSGIVESSYENQYYERKDVAKSDTGFSRQPEFREFVEINDELKKIQSVFYKVISQRNNEILNFNLQKYNVVTGLINELIESNNVKVIIICNTDIIGNNYMDKVFRGKLDCITYHKNVERESLVHIFNKSLQNQVFNNKEVNLELSKKITDIVNDFEPIWMFKGTNNLREIKSIFQAFLDTVSELENYIEMNTFENRLSLFYSIYVVSISIERKNIKDYEYFPVGGNLLFYLELYGKSKEVDIIRKSQYCNSIKWFGISLSGYWILNFPKPKNIEIIQRKYLDYPFNLLESQLIDYNAVDNLVIKDVSMEHILFIIKQEAQTRIEDRTPKLDLISQQALNLLPKVLLNTDDLKLATENFLSSIDDVLGGMFQSEFLNKWLVSIYATTQIKKVENEERSYVLNQYHTLTEQEKD